MAEHVAPVSLSRSAPKGGAPPPQLMGHGRWNTSSSQDSPYRAAGASNRGGSSNDMDVVQHLLFSIVQHDKFNTWFPCIKSCLQLSDKAWSRFSQLRDDPETRSILEPSHSSIFHIPPQDVWSFLVRLRQHPAFLKLQSAIVGRVEHAHCQTHSSAFTQHSSRPPNEQHNWNQSDFTSASTLPSSIQTPFIAFNNVEQNAPVARSDSRQRTKTSVSSPIRNSVVGNSGNQRHRPKQAPDGMWYHCPSRGCPKKPFKRLAHYKRHMDKHHPDFGPQHPNHVPQMSLHPRTASSTSNDRSKPNVRFEEGALTTNGEHLSSSKDFATSRRGSHLSLSSLNSLGVSSQAIDDTSDDPLIGESNRSGFSTSMMPNVDNNMWFMGGGAQMNGGMSFGSDNTYYGGMQNM